MSTHRPFLAASAAALCFLTAACGGGASPDSDDAEAAPGASGSAGAGYPVTLENCGQELTFDQAPERVVVMNGATVAEVSTLLALGLGDRIVANQQTYGMSEVPGRAKAIDELPDGGIELNDAFDIPREAMISLRPDLVLSTTAYGFDGRNGFATRDQLREAGAATYVSPRGCDQDTTAMTIEDSYRLLRDLGRVFDVGDKAEELIADSKREIAAVAEKVAGEERPKVMVVISNMSMGTNDFSSIAAKGIYNDILDKAGAVNAFEDASETAFADLSKEKVAATDVDALVVIGYNDPDPAGYAEKLLKEFPQWPAAENDAYLTLSDSIYLGPSNALAVEEIAKTLHPDAF
ncbi:MULTISPECIES: ABC transporter substrate-binding protein [unclassified Streptomyces]|uniref:ABC transporter substrate-binding protein n=1 Tax=unclassified Streptomyces TaxID=2593676 RepID=UPI00190629FD|nr:ABC transporter substrate-binding protein [Streptomyces sp. HSG2]